MQTRGVETRHHARQFNGPVLISHRNDPTRRHLAIVGLDYDVVPIGEGGNLRQMRHHNDLRVLGRVRASRRPTSTATLPPTPASTSSKDQRDSLVISREHNLQSQPDSRELTAGCNATKAPDLAARVGGKHQIDAIRAGWPQLGAGYLKPQPSVRHREVSKFTDHQFSESGRRLAPCRADLGRRDTSSALSSATRSSSVVISVVAGLRAG